MTLKLIPEWVKAILVQVYDQKFPDANFDEKSFGCENQNF